jgi:diaminohydroxyphosphoribosylaminopyrimidine deaminase/5-amino-6-(5-phosphoribosylamino)uracil reductase
MKADMVDEVWLLRGPAPIGEGGVPALEGLPLTAITQSAALKQRGSETLQTDTLTIYERT